MTGTYASIGVEAPAAEAPTVRPRVLVVDDERTLLGLVAMMLGEAGYEVITAYDGETALKRIRDESPDLVLLDLGLPRLSGDEVARSIVELSLAPLIVLTGRKDPREVARFLDLGVDDYVAKPFDRRELLARIRATLARAERVHGTRTLGGLAIDTSRFEARVDGKRLALTPTEFRILARLARGAMVSNEMLLRAGWPGTNSELQPESLRAPTHRLRAKLAAARSGLRIENIRGIGYRLAPDR